MDRRTAIKKLALATSGALTFSFKIGWIRDDISNIESIFSDTEAQIISKVVDVILPFNGEIGGLSVGVDPFIIALISECEESEIQMLIKDILHEANQYANQQFKQSIIDCSQHEGEKILNSFTTGTDEQKIFFEYMKSQAIRGFETSKEVLENYYGYVLMPGFYDGNVEVDNG